MRPEAQVSNIHICYQCTVQCMQQVQTVLHLLHGGAVARDFLQACLLMHSFGRSQQEALSAELTMFLYPQMSSSSCITHTTGFTQV